MEGFKNVHSLLRVLQHTNCLQDGYNKAYENLSDHEIILMKKGFADEKI